MQIITKELDEIIDIPNNSCVFDIETTGLSQKFCKVILVGILYIKNNKTIITQFFAESTDDEKELLFFFKNVFIAFDSHISFNGIAFDIPFLNARFKANNIDYIIDKSKDIDILKLVKPYKDKLSLSDCKLKTIEKYLGINRKDTISGKDSVDMYKEFEKTKDDKLKKKILLHNFEDIYYLSKILKIKDCIEENVDLLDINDNLKLFLKNYKLKKNILSATFEDFNNNIHNINIYKEGYSIKSSESLFVINIEIKNGIDSDNNEIMFFYMNNIIPLSVNGNILEKNIISLSKFLIYKELNNIIPIQ